MPVGKTMPVGKAKTFGDGGDGLPAGMTDTTGTVVSNITDPAQLRALGYHKLSWVRTLEQIPITLVRIRLR